jgi:amidase
MKQRITRRELLQAAVAAPTAAILGGCAGAGGSKSAPGPLAELDGVATAAAIRTGQLGVGEVIEAAITRSQAIEPRINAIVTESFDRARKAAREPLSGPFAGVPTYIKDLLDVHGLPTRNGSRASSPTPATAQAPYMDALDRAGLVTLGKSSTPEWALTGSTEPLLHGPTRNPWNLEYSPGGSSGGAAALVAARVVPVANATDGGGSIRVPASCCGVFGLKPSRGRNPPTGRPVGPVDISVAHAVSISVRDSAQWLEVTERRDREAPHPPVGRIEGPVKRRLRIALDLEPLLGGSIDPEVRAAIEDTARHCEALGHRVEVAPLPLAKAEFTDAFMLYWSSGAWSVVEALAKRLGRPPTEAELEPWTLGLASRYRERRTEFEAAVATLHASVAVYEKFFAAWDVLLTPVMTRLPPRVGELAPDLPFEIQYERASTLVGFTPVQNATGAPAMSVPLHWSKSGLPIGSHFAAKAGDERTLLELAYELEDAHPWAGRRPPVAAA